MTSRYMDRNSDRGPDGGRKQVSLMHVFRSAYEAKDAQSTSEPLTNGDRELSRRSLERRQGTDEASLRRHLTADLGSLLNTVNLNAVVDLTDHPYVLGSVVNFGFDDMSQSSDDAHAGKKIARTIRDTLRQHEPRLISESLEIGLRDVGENTNQRLSFDISAEMVATPVDVPVEFVAEIDKGAGKIQTTKIKVQT